MTQLDTTALEALRDRKPTGKPKWAPLQLDTLHPGTFLAADQSLTAFGLVLFEVSPERQCAVHLAQTFGVPEGDDTGPDALLRRMGALEDQLTSYVDQWVLRSDWGLVAAVHELPPIMKGRMANAAKTRPEISFMSALAFRNATRDLALLPSVARNSHAHLLCGVGSVKDKKTYHGPLRELFPQIRGSELVTNEGKRDALSLGLYASWREARLAERNGRL